MAVGAGVGFVDTDVGAGVATRVGVSVGVGSGVRIGVGVEVGVGVSVGMGAGVDVGVGVGVDSLAQAPKTSANTRAHPSARPRPGRISFLIPSPSSPELILYQELTMRHSA